MALSGCNKETAQGNAAESGTGSKAGEPTPASTLASAPTSTPTSSESQPVEVSSSAPVEAPVLTPKAGTDWSKIETDTLQFGKSDAPQIDPSTISLSGIPKPSRGFGDIKETGFRVSYAPSIHPVSEQIRLSFQQEKVFETITAALNETLDLPRVIDIHLVDCGTVNAFYDPNNSRIIVCYELITYFLQIFEPVTNSSEELGTAAIGATFFAFFHELGHSLVHTLKLPVTGKEEDAVDQLATLVLMEGGEEGTKAALAGAQWFLLKSAENEKNPEAAKKLPFWDEHSLDQQRFYSIACLIYGANPGRYSGLVHSGVLPEPRAKRCPQEYKQISSAWDTLLTPHFKKSTDKAPVASEGTNTQLGTPVDVPLGAPPSGNADCEAATAHIVKLMTEEAVAKLEGLPPAEAQAAMDELSLTLPLMGQALYETCLDEKWTPQVIQCVQGAKSSAEGEKCIP